MLKILFLEIAWNLRATDAALKTGRPLNDTTPPPFVGSKALSAEGRKHTMFAASTRITAHRKKQVCSPWAVVVCCDSNLFFIHGGGHEWKEQKVKIFKDIQGLTGQKKRQKLQMGCVP